jgi:hypothetical protein
VRARLVAAYIRSRTVAVRAPTPPR